jgi:hypothetical protein
MTEQDIKTFSGTWYARVTYPNKDESGEDVTINCMEAQKIGKEIVLTSEPNDEGSHTVIRVTIDGDVATGSWHETTSPTGNFAGAMYSGAGQLLVSGDGKEMEGQWAGAGYDHSEHTPNIYTGSWKLSRSKLQ